MAQHHAHLAELQQHQRQVEAEHLFEMQQQGEQQRWIEAEQHQEHLMDLQRQQDEQRKREHLAHLAELHRQQEQQRQMQAEQQQIIQQEAAEHLQVVINNNRALQNVPKGCCPYEDPAHRHSLGSMDVVCPNCHALHFNCEKLTNSSNINPKFGICCLQGQIQLPPLSQSPPLLHQLPNSSAPRA